MTGTKRAGKQADEPSDPSTNESPKEHSDESLYQGRDEMFMDIDRMVNDGLGGGIVSPQNGLIDESTTDTMELPESVSEE